MGGAAAAAYLHASCYQICWFFGKVPREGGGEFSIHLRGSHGLSTRRAQRTKSSRPEGPQTKSWGPEDPKTSSIQYSQCVRCFHQNMWKNGLSKLNVQLSFYSMFQCSVWILSTKGRHQLKKNVFFRALPELPNPPPMTPIRATWSSFFGSRNSRFESQFRTKNTIYAI